jgi:urease accessory protein
MAAFFKSLGFMLAVFAGATSVAYAHGGVGLSAGFSGGFFHPLSGLDHIAAMVAVGLWGAFLGRPAIWVLPIVFPLVMVGGGILGMLGVPFPAVEFGIAASAIVLGLMVTLAVRPPIWVAAIIVGTFATFHGYAHGAELPAAADPLAYSAGFVIATGTLHLLGIAFGLLTEWPAGRIAVRVGGGLITLLGVGFLTGVITA